MKFTPVDIEVLREKRIYKRTKNLTLIEDFLASGEKCVRLDDSHYKNPYSGYSAIKKSADTYHYGDTIGVTVHNNNLYLYRKESLNDLETR